MRCWSVAGASALRAPCSSAGFLDHHYFSCRLWRGPSGRIDPRLGLPYLEPSTTKERHTREKLHRTIVPHKERPCNMADGANFPDQRSAASLLSYALDTGARGSRRAPKDCRDTVKDDDRMVCDTALVRTSGGLAQPVPGVGAFRWLALNKRGRECCTISGRN